jgi:glycosyltransferase involved in cell wall biosynthesis
MITNAALASEASVVAVSTYGFTGASSRVRMYEWFEKLHLDAEVYDYVGTSDNQVSTLASHASRVVIAEAHLRALVSRVEGRTLLLSRQASPFSSGHLEESLLKRAALSVYDFDDAIWADTGSWSRRIWSKRSVWERSTDAADVVIAGSEFLADAASVRSNRVVMIPSCVDPAAYARKRNYDLPEAPRAIWLGSPATEPFLLALGKTLLALNAKYGLRLKVISGPTSRLGALEAIVDRVAWSLNSFGSELADADLGIMPLPDTEYARGKCSYKLLQYAAAGLPVVGSPVGTNGPVLETMGGLPATTNSEWYEACAVILDATSEARAKMGAKIHDAVVRDFSYSAWSSAWRAALGISKAIDEKGSS